MNSYLNIKTLAFFILLPVFIASCARTSNPNIQRGSDYNYVEGYPEVRLSAIGFLNEDNTPSINVVADIVYNSLIFKANDDDEQEADITIFVRVQEKEGDKEVVENKEYDVTINESDIDPTGIQNAYVFDERIDVPPNQYQVEFTVIDNNSDKDITQTAETSIPDPESDSTDLTEIRMLGKDMDSDNPEWLPITTYSVPSKVDSLMFVFQATNNDPEQPLDINSKLIQFESDTSYARNMHSNNYSSSSIQHKGIDLSERTTLEESERSLPDQGSVFIEFRFDQQERGNYRFEVSNSEDEKELFKARDFGVKSENYPNVTSAKELAQPLAYLMRERDYEELMSINDPDSLKKEIDRFWLKSIGNEREAANVVRMYYERVEEANKQFANFKEGWKTDPGMVYILFGPPWYVDHRVGSMRWSFSYNRSDPEYNFYYDKPKLNNEFYPFDHFLLQRSQNYFNVQYRQRQLWLNGLILKRQL